MRIVLLGTSHWHAQMHMDAALFAGASIAGVWDEDAEKADAFATQAGLRRLDSIADAVDLRPDLIVLMGHPAALPGRATTIVEAGVPLILEKPAASTTAALAPLRELAN